MAETIETRPIATEVRERFLNYALSVVKSRALPDVRDGLKPVQRRILYAMYHDLNLTFDRKALKCAKIVGDVMGNYHPHGDGALYEALVRMAQSWVLRVPLVHGQGNFGSVDGDPPAAYRYTEAKLTRAAEMLLGELDQETVDLVPNYDGTRRQPAVLPAQYPNLLVNGTSGIAVGMATNIPPHNLAEVLRACIVLIENPDATIAVLMEKIKGPDFPLGGKIITDRPTLRRIYEQGSGSIKVQGEWQEEKLDNKGRVQIVVNSIPYGVDKGELEQAIGRIIDERRLPQLLGQANESNEKDGLRLVLEVKPGTDPNLIMAYLYKHTDLQKNFSYNITALIPNANGTDLVPADGLSLKDLIRHFLDFRLITVRRRFEYHLRQIKKRIHILEGFAVIFNALDRAIKIIRESSGKPDAAEKLIAAFKLDEEQVNAILDAQLYKIAQMEIKKILEELAEKKKEAQRIESILASQKKLWGIVKGELESIIEKFPERRKTRMASDDDVLTFDEEAYIVRENTNVVLTRDGIIKRVGRLQSLESTRVKEGDEVVAVIPGSTLDHIVFFADDGTAYTMRINEIPATTGYGEPITKYFKFADGVKVIAAITTDRRFTPPAETGEGDAIRGPFLLVATRAGNVSQIPLNSFRTESTKTGRRFVRLEPADKVTLVGLVGEASSVMLASVGGYIIHFPIDEVGILSGPGKGVIGIKLEKDVCVGGILVGGRFDKLVLETENNKLQEFGPGAIKIGPRARKGDKPRERTKFVRVMPAAIELINWDEVEGRKPTSPKLHVES